MTYYLKYRPSNLNELDLKDVRDQLKSIVKSGKIPHAFLFSGPKGTGKTSAARILAKVVNCLKKRADSTRPCNNCEQCKSISTSSNLDVIELDAASHRGIDDVRTLRDAVKLSPAKAVKKVYIIDEAHMLTTEAANALLKTLEEPPDHVMFILATTNPEKLPETIRSRTTNIIFKKAKEDELVRSLNRVVKDEKIKIERLGLGMIANTSDGSFRDATKILEQVVLKRGKRLSKSFLEEFLVSVRPSDIDKFIEKLIAKDARGAIKEIEDLVEKGSSITDFTKGILERLRKSLLAKAGFDEDEFPQIENADLIHLIKLIKATPAELKNALISQLPLEVAVIEWCGDVELEDEFVKIEEEESEPERVRKKPASFKQIDEVVWKQILSEVRPLNTSVEALLRATRPIDFDGETLRLDVFYQFHKERLEDAHHKRLLEEVATRIIGSQVRVICTLAPPPPREVKESKKDEVVLTEGGDEDIINVAKEIFGG